MHYIRHIGLSTLNFTLILRFLILYIYFHSLIGNSILVLIFHRLGILPELFAIKILHKVVDNLLVELDYFTLTELLEDPTDWIVLVASVDEGLILAKSSIIEALPLLSFVPMADTLTSL